MRKESVIRLLFLFLSKGKAMTLREIRSDILLIAQHSKVSKDKRLWEPHMDWMIHKYRAVGIRENYQKEGLIDPNWIQDLGIKKLNIIDAGEEVSIACSDRQLGKVILPKVLPLKNHNGVIRVSGSSREKTYYDIDVERFFDLDPSSLRAKFNYYFRIGDAFYLTPPPQEAHFALILDNPMDGYFFDNTQQTVIRPQTNYTVVDGAVTYNGTIYAQGNTFIGVFNVPSFTGNGTVHFAQERRPITEDDTYPISFSLAEFIVTNVLMRDLEIESKKVADIKNDNADQLSMMQQGNR